MLRWGGSQCVTITNAIIIIIITTTTTHDPSPTTPKTSYLFISAPTPPQVFE